MIKSLRDVDVTGKRVILRTGFDVPLAENGSVGDDTRIRDALPTITYLLKHHAKIIILSHLQRPEGKVVEKLRFGSVAQRLSELLKKPVKKVDDCIGPAVESTVATMHNGDILLLENVRFHKEEESKKPEERDALGKQLAALGEIYVNEAFSNCHRDYASMTSVPKYIPGCMGFGLQREIETITNTVANPQHPFVAIIGGAKLETKIPVINHLLNKVDNILLGGGMIYTFYKVQGYDIGKSLYDKNQEGVARDLLTKSGDKIVLPTDIVIAQQPNAPHEKRVVKYNTIPSGWIGLDIGPESVKQFISVLSTAKTVIWNGPLGMFEVDAFAQGTYEIAKYLATLKTTVVIGGGDSAAALDKFGLSDTVTLVSTGGGASLELFAGKTLPGIKALEENAQKFW